jgi:hypothetical protein
MNHDLDGRGLEAAAIAACIEGKFDPLEVMSNDGPRWKYYLPGVRAAITAYLSALPAIGEVAVKPLDWLLHHDETGMPVWRAKKPFGSSYHVEGRDLEQWEWMGTIYDHIEAAKADAQADYEARIRSSLVDHGQHSSRAVSQEGGEAYLIRKSGAWYRPNSAGYTTNIAEAGRYTLAEAEAITHPNGPDGPRDSMSYEVAPTLTEMAKAVGEWVLVPREPTDEQVAAGLESLASSTGEPSAHIVRDALFAYRAMLAAAPFSAADVAVPQAAADYLVYDWAWTDETGQEHYARTPERAERLRAQGVKLTTVYTRHAAAPPNPAETQAVEVGE